MKCRWWKDEERNQQRELSQDEERDKVESTETEGEDKIGPAREAFEPRDNEETAMAARQRQDR